MDMTNNEKLTVCIERSGLLKYFVATEHFRVTPKTLTYWLKDTVPRQMKHRKAIEKFTKNYCSGNQKLIARIEDWD